jgi:hypothetical protein
VQITRIRVVIFLSVALACSRQPNAEVSNKEVPKKPDVLAEAAQPATEPTEPSKPMKAGGDV